MCGMQGTFLTPLLELASWTFQMLEPILEVGSGKEGDKIKCLVFLAYVFWEGC